MPSTLLQPNKGGLTPRAKLQRIEVQVNVGTTDSRLLGPNPRRVALILSTPSGGSSGGQTTASVTKYGTAVADTATGVLPGMTYTCPVGRSAIFNYADVMVVTGTGHSIRPRVIPSGGSSTSIGPNITVATPTMYNMPIGPGDNVFLNVETLSAGGSVDAIMGITEYSSSGGTTDNTVYISLDGPATVNGGMSLHPGAPPLVLTGEHIGQAFIEEIRGIAANAPVTLTFWDIFEIDCPCQSDY